MHLRRPAICRALWLCADASIRTCTVHLGVHRPLYFPPQPPPPCAGPVQAPSASPPANAAAFGAAFAAAGAAVTANPALAPAFVWVPAGVFSTGSFNLSSEVYLCLADGAEVLGSNDPRDYVLVQRWCWCWCWCRGVQERPLSKLAHRVGCTSTTLAHAAHATQAAHPMYLARQTLALAAVNEWSETYR